MLLYHMCIESFVAVEDVPHSLTLTNRTAMSGGSLQKLLSARAVIHAIVRIVIGLQLSFIKCKKRRTSR
eukprot:15264611-Heterocapsa_arctica.AAC.1